MQKKNRKALKEESKEEVHPQLDDVSRALLTHMEETGRSSKEDLLKVDAVTEESASFINKYRQYILPAYQFVNSEHAITIDNLIFQLVLYTL